MQWPCVYGVRRFVTITGHCCCSSSSLWDIGTRNAVMTTITPPAFCADNECGGITTLISLLTDARVSIWWALRTLQRQGPIAVSVSHEHFVSVWSTDQHRTNLAVSITRLSACTITHAYSAYIDARKSVLQSTNTKKLERSLNCNTTKKRIMIKVTHDIVGAYWHIAVIHSHIRSTVYAVATEHGQSFNKQSLMAENRGSRLKLFLRTFPWLN